MYGVWIVSEQVVCTDRQTLESFEGKKVRIGKEEIEFKMSDCELYAGDQRAINVVKGLGLNKNIELVEG